MKKILKAGILGTLGVLMLTSAVELRAASQYRYDLAQIAGNEAGERWWNEYGYGAAYHDGAVYIDPPADQNYPDGYKFALAITAAYNRANPGYMDRLLDDINGKKKTYAAKIVDYCNEINSILINKFKEQDWESAEKDKNRRRLQPTIKPTISPQKKLLYVFVGTGGSWLAAYGVTTFLNMEYSWNANAAKTSSIITAGGLVYDLCNEIRKKNIAGWSASAIGVTVINVRDLLLALRQISATMTQTADMQGFADRMENGSLDQTDEFYDCSTTEWKDAWSNHSANASP